MPAQARGQNENASKMSKSFFILEIRTRRNKPDELACSVSPEIIWIYGLPLQHPHAGENDHDSPGEVLKSLQGLQGLVHHGYVGFVVVIDA